MGLGSRGRRRLVGRSCPWEVGVEDGRDADLERRGERRGGRRVLVREQVTTLPQAAVAQFKDRGLVHESRIEGGRWYYCAQRVAPPA